MLELHSIPADHRYHPDIPALSWLQRDLDNISAEDTNNGSGDVRETPVPRWFHCQPNRRLSLFSNSISTYVGAQ
jgi:hypothetical protein